MLMVGTGTPCGGSSATEPERPVQRHWRQLFIDHLAATSNVAAAAAHAGVTLSRAYRARRSEAEFARLWLAALAEGYLHLEMELVRRLREGDCLLGDGQKFDFASAIRLLAAHKGAAGNGQMPERDVSAAEVRAAIDRKIEDIRRRMERTKQADKAAR
jgi:hypothetical protein